MSFNHIKIPCGKVLGHGEYCSKDYLCDQCEFINKLEQSVQRQFQTGYNMGYDNGYSDGYTDGIDKCL